MTTTFYSLKPLVDKTIANRYSLFMLSYHQFLQMSPIAVNYFYVVSFI